MTQSDYGVPVLPGDPLQIAFAALRSLLQASKRVVIVEDQLSAQLLTQLPEVNDARIVNNLSQLGCTHRPHETQLRGAKMVLEIAENSIRLAKESDREGRTPRLESRFQDGLRAIVDRDISPSFLPEHLYDNTAPGSPHASAAMRCAIVRCTPLNDMESTFFANDLGLLTARLGLGSAARDALNADATASDYDVGRSMLREWLVPMFCIRSYFLRQQPKISSRAMTVAIATRAAFYTLGNSPQERGTKLAQYVLPKHEHLDPAELNCLKREIEVAIDCPKWWTHLVHGHDLMQILTALNSADQGTKYLPSEFETDATGNLSDSPALRLFRQQEQALALRALREVCTLRQQVSGTEALMKVLTDCLK